MTRLLMIAAACLVTTSAQAADAPWIIDDWPAAQKLARRLECPIFVVFRCEY